MTLLMTLLTLFLGGKPQAALPPEPAGTITAAVYEEPFDVTTTGNGPLGLPLITSAARHSSPSLMVAVPPKGVSTAFDVFSPAVRPPHEFPTLFPCEAVALVPCPAPLPRPNRPPSATSASRGKGPISAWLNSRLKPTLNAKRARARWLATAIHFTMSSANLNGSIPRRLDSW